MPDMPGELVILNFILWVWMFACVSVCVPHICLAPMEARRGCQILWDENF